MAKALTDGADEGKSGGMGMGRASRTPRGSPGAIWTELWAPQGGYAAAAAKPVWIPLQCSRVYYTALYPPGPALEPSRDVMPRYTQYTSRNHTHRHWGGQCDAQGGSDRSMHARARSIAVPVAVRGLCGARMRVPRHKHSIRNSAQMQQSKACAGPVHVTGQAQPLNLPPRPQQPTQQNYQRSNYASY